MLSLASNMFLEPMLLALLLLLIPFFIMYLIKSKPQFEVLPSLMFLFKDKDNKKKNSFLQKFVRDPLFFLQLLILLLLLFSASKPYLSVPKESLFKNNVVVLDASSSMNTAFDSTTRFNEAKKIAKDSLGAVNTLILAKNVPEVTHVEEGAGKISGYLNTLEATDTTTNLYESIITAASYANSDTRIIVISDFLQTETREDLQALRNSLQAQGIKVDYEKVYQEKKNFGIVELDIGEEETKATIKNFNQEPYDVQIKIGEKTETLSIKELSQETISFSTPQGNSKIEILTKDDFSNDNVAYISTPTNSQKRALLITNNKNPQKTFIYNAIDLMKNIDITVASPPQVPSLEGFDIYIFKDVSASLILPREFREAERLARENGKSVIIMAQSDFLAVNYQDLLRASSSKIIKQNTNIYAKGSTITKDIDIGFTKKYFDFNPYNNSGIISLAATEDNNPIITYRQEGKGKIFFYGILDEDDDAEAFFSRSPQYFVFWKRLLDFATNTPSLKNLNQKTNNIVSLGEKQTIATPNGKITTDKLELEKTGLYNLKDRIIVANLLNEQESYINEIKVAESSSLTAKSSGNRFNQKVPFEITDYLLIAAIILLLLEIVYIKFRGDI
jgi:hypothetical protein